MEDQMTIEIATEIDQKVLEPSPPLQPIEEKFPPVTHLRIVYSHTKITENSDPILAAVYGYSNKVIAMSYFTMQDGTVGTAFFCEMKPEWQPPSQDEIAKSVAQLEKPPEEGAHPTP